MSSNLKIGFATEAVDAAHAAEILSALHSAIANMPHMSKLMTTKIGIAIDANNAGHASEIAEALEEALSSLNRPTEATINTTIKGKIAAGSFQRVSLRPLDIAIRNAMEPLEN